MSNTLMSFMIRTTLFNAIGLQSCFYANTDWFITRHNCDICCEMHVSTRNVLIFSINPLIRRTPKVLNDNNL